MHSTQHTHKICIKDESRFRLSTDKFLTALIFLSNGITLPWKMTTWFLREKWKVCTKENVFVADYLSISQILLCWKEMWTSPKFEEATAAAVSFIPFVFLYSIFNHTDERFLILIENIWFVLCLTVNMLPLFFLFNIDNVI